jgi:hypothetical protein
MGRLTALVLGLIFSVPAYAQGPIQVPNPMAAHTLFIILITAAFLAWAASFSIQIMKEQTHRKDRQALRRHRETIFDKITELETARESGTINKDRHKRRMRELRGKLSRVIEKLQSSPSREKKHV